MSGIGHSAVSTPFTGNNLIDALLTGTRWDAAILTYGFGQSVSQYGSGYPTNYDFLGTFSPMNSQQREMVSRILDADYGDGSYGAFSFEGLTEQNVQFTTATNPHIRAANAAEAPFGYGFYPATNLRQAGDFWIGDDYAGSSFDARNPIPGNYSHMLHMHEIGHALGLEHAHEGGATLNAAYDYIEFTVMTYRSYAGGPLFYAGGAFDFPQSFMTLDIQALQHLYGANFDTNSDDTVYSWSPDAGDTVINDGATGITAQVNKVFLTIWDGGGTDTYDLSAYTDNVSIDLSPGASTSFDNAQRAFLGDGNFALGNIHNALLYQGDTRSLIENATGGIGDDIMIGNVADNRLDGNLGDDVLTGGSGQDTFVFKIYDVIENENTGADRITDFESVDYIEIDMNPYTTLADLQGLMTDFQGYTILDLGGASSIRIDGWQAADFTEGNFRLTGFTQDGIGPFRRDYVDLGIDKGVNNAKPEDSDALLVYEDFTGDEVAEAPLPMTVLPVSAPYEALSEMDFAWQDVLSDFGIWA